MTYREKYFELKKLNNKYLTLNVIKAVLMDDGSFDDFFTLISNFDKNIQNEKLLNEKINRIKVGEPYQYVLGYAYFVNSNYIVSPDVLIPRQETEQLAVTTMSLIVKLFGKNPKINIVDVAAGSGILSIYLKEYFENSNVIGTDISEKCIRIANENAKKHNVKINYIQTNLLDNIDGPIDVLISNPPYIDDKKTVDEQTLKYEPHLALFASPSTKYYEEILNHINLMNKKFLIAFEIGENMEEELTKIIKKKFKNIYYKFEKDMYNKTRFLYIIKDVNYVE